MNQISEQITIEINRILKPIQGVFSIYFRDINTGYEFKLNENEPYNTASLMKVVVGLQLVRLIETRQLKKNSTIELKNTFASKYDNSLFQLSETMDAEKSLYSKTGVQVSVLELLELMITESSNLATNNLFQLIENYGSISDLLTELEMTDTHILRGVEDQKAYDAGMINTTTATDMVKLYLHISQLVSAGNVAATMLFEAMKRQKHNSIIPFLLPEKLHIAHKTGTLQSSIHDAALVSSDTGKNYLLVLLSKDLEDRPMATLALANVSNVFYLLTTDCLPDSSKAD